MQTVTTFRTAADRQHLADLSAQAKQLEDDVADAFNRAFRAFGPLGDHRLRQVVATLEQVKDEKPLETYVRGLKAAVRLFDAYLDPQTNRGNFDFTLNFWANPRNQAPKAAVAVMNAPPGTPMPVAPSAPPSSAPVIAAFAARGIMLTLNDAGDVLARPAALLTDADRETIRKWKLSLVRDLASIEMI